MIRSHDNQRGVALVLAIFIITVLAALGAYIVGVSAIQHQTAALSLQQMRALNAARSGAQWGAHYALTHSACPSGTSFSPAASDLASFTVAVDCSNSVHVVGSDTIHVYVLHVNAHAGGNGSPDAVRRTIQMVVSDGG